MHSIEWRKVAAPAVAGASVASTSAGKWLILADSGGMGAACAALLEAQGEACICAITGERYQRLKPTLYLVDPGNADDYRSLLRDAFDRNTPCRGVIHLFGLDATPWERTTAASLEDDQRVVALSALFTIQAILRHTWRDKPKLWLVTRGTQAVGRSPAQVAVAQAPLGGIARTIGLEHPELACAFVDLPNAPTADDVGALVSELRATDHEDRVALRPDGRFVARIASSAFDAAPARDFRLREDGCYLITGGLGGLGLAVARWMATQGARNLVLVGRSAPAKAGQDAIAEMEGVGAQVLVMQGDVASAEGVASVLAQARARLPPLRGVVHAAGVVADGTVLKLDRQRFRQVFPAKVQGSWNLHAATRDLPLDFFVLFSSAASLIGSPGQVNYAAANAFMDALAHARQAEGLPAMSIHWGPFSAVGMAAELEDHGTRLADRGLESMTPEEGMRALARLLVRPRAEVGILRLNVRRWLDVLPQAAGSPFWAELRGSGETKAPVAEAAHAFRRTLEGAEPEPRAALLERHVREQLGPVFRVAPDRIDMRLPFRNMGVDSLMSLEIKNRLERSLGISLPATLLFTYATTEALVVHLLAELRRELERGGDDVEPVADSPPPGAAEGEASPEDDLLADFEQTMQLVKGKRP